jgi:nucleolar protein 58
LGAEKALFRALKTKKDTPKYGLIYHSTLVGQASTKNKGKISRSLAAKASLATRLDAFGEDSTFDLGTEHRARLETRLRILEEGSMKKLSGTGKVKVKFEKHQVKSEIKLYPTEEDNQIPIVMSKKRKLDTKPLIEEIKSEPAEEEGESSMSPPKKKKKKDKSKTLDESELAETMAVDEVIEEETPKKKKKKNKGGDESIADESVIVEEAEEVKSEKKKKKKKKQAEDDE